MHIIRHMPPVVPDHIADQRRLATLEIREAKRDLSPDELAEISGLRRSLRQLGVDVTKKKPAEILLP